MSSREMVLEKLKNYNGSELKFMEVCGTHTDSIHKNGIPSLISDKIKLISGPGCPVCVTVAGFIDYAAELAQRADSVLYTFGDMMRVPGNKTSLYEARANGGRVEMMYSPLQVLDRAQSEPNTTFYIAAVGFETTTPIYAMMLERMLETGIRNIKFLTALKTIMPALAVIGRDKAGLCGFIGPGHVSVILGSDAYVPICLEYQIPMAVAGFSAEHVLAGIYDLVVQNEKQTSEVHNLYKSVVSQGGSDEARAVVSKYFEAADAYWRGFGVIKNSGMVLKPEYSQFDAGTENIINQDDSDKGCACGLVITGKISPNQCGYFGRECTPANPKGACMVSGEGSCSIYYRNGVGLS